MRISTVGNMVQFIVLVLSMFRSDKALEAVMLAEEEAGRVRERQNFIPQPPQQKTPCHRRRSKRLVARRPIRTRLGSTARCVSHARTL